MALRKKNKNRNQAVHNAVLQVKKFRATRAVYETADHQEVELDVITEDNEVVTLRFRSNLVPPLVTEFMNAYEAINPPMFRGSRASNWDGME